MSQESRAKLRLKLPSGAEIEAEGSADFVRKERDAFLAAQPPSAGEARSAAGPEAAPEGGGGVMRGAQSGSPGLPDWDRIIESRAGRLQLRAKLREGRTERDACLVLLGAAQRLLNQAKPTAAQLAKWLRASGYPVRRMDRALAEAMDKGELLASGSRRSRRYELTGPGRMKAIHLACQLDDLIGR